MRNLRHRMVAKVTQLYWGFIPSHPTLSVLSATLHPQLLIHFLFPSLDFCCTQGPLSPSACEICFSRLFSLTPPSLPLQAAASLRDTRGPYWHSLLAGLRLTRDSSSVSDSEPGWCHQTRGKEWSALGWLVHRIPNPASAGSWYIPSSVSPKMPVVCALGCCRGGQGYISRVSDWLCPAVLMAMEIPPLELFSLLTLKGKSG